jgi:serine/threonine protein phosphatase 1
VSICPEEAAKMLKWRAKEVDKPARVPIGTRIYAIGDIHGCADLLDRAFRFIDGDIARSGAQRIVHVFLGDYVDRGPDTRRTIDLLVDRGDSHEAVFLRGNHEALMQDFLREPSVLSNWWSLGGAATLMSFGLAPSPKQSPTEGFSLRDQLISVMQSSHHRFLGSLQSAYTCGDFFFTHAGVRPGIALDLQSDADLMWIREPFLSSHQYFGKMVVHGHTPVHEPDIRSNRINIDTGAYATGCLSVLSIEDDRLGIHLVRRSGVDDFNIPRRNEKQQ